MGFTKPTKEGIDIAIDEGWNKESAKRGYGIFDYDCTGMLEVEAICACYPTDEYEKNLEDGEKFDEVCAHEAERTGLCKIIPVEELPENFEHDGNSLRWFGWVDTPENRKAIEKYCRKN